MSAIDWENTCQSWSTFKLGDHHEAVVECERPANHGSRDDDIYAKAHRQMVVADGNGHQLITYEWDDAAAGKGEKPKRGGGHDG